MEHTRAISPYAPPSAYVIPLLRPGTHNALQTEGTTFSQRLQADMSPSQDMQENVQVPESRACRSAESGSQAEPWYDTRLVASGRDELGVRRVAEHTAACSSQVGPLHACQVGDAHREHRERPAHDAREVEGTTQSQYRHERDDELGESFANVASRATWEGHVSPKNVHVPAQLAFHVAVHDQLQAKACSHAFEVQRMPSTLGLCEQDQQQYPELFEAPQEMQQGSVSQASLNAEREAPQGCAQPQQHAQPEVHDCREVERTTHWQRPHQHHNEQEHSRASSASRAICQVPSQSAPPCC